MSIQEQDIIDIYPRIMAFAFSKTRDKQKANTNKPNADS